MPDFDDSTKAILVKLEHTYEIAILVIDNQLPRPFWLQNYQHQVIKKQTLKGLYWFFSSKIIFYTHGCFNTPFLIPNQIIINLWHGMPIKKVGNYQQQVEKNFVKFNYATVTSEYYQQIMSKVFSVPPEKILITGLPRNEPLLQKPSSTINQRLNLTDKKLLVWLPTYRTIDKQFDNQTFDGDITDNLFNIPDLDIENFDYYLESHNIVCLLKIHPMTPASLLGNLKHKKLKAIKIINDQYLHKINITLHELLARSDALITDVSSTYIDYLLTDKPIIIAFSDEDLYMKGRGTIYPFDQAHIPGHRVKDYNKLLFTIEELLIHKKDKYLPERLIAKKTFPLSGDRIY